MRRLEANDASRLAGVLLELERELTVRRMGSDVAVEGSLTLLSVALTRAMEGDVAERRHDTNPVVSRALEFVHRRDTSGISLRDVAAHMGRPLAHVASLVGAAPMDPAIEAKTTRACRRARRPASPSRPLPRGCLRQA